MKIRRPGIRIGTPNQVLMTKDGRAIARINPLLGFYGRFRRGQL